MKLGTELVDPCRVASQGQVSRSNSKLEPIWRTTPKGLAYPVEMLRLDGLHPSKSSGLEIPPRRSVDGPKQRVLETRTEIACQLQAIKVEIHFMEAIALQCRPEEKIGYRPPEAVHQQVVSPGHFPDVWEFVNAPWGALANIEADLADNDPGRAGPN